MEDLEAKIEAVLFVSGEPVSLKKLSAALGVAQGQASEALLRLGENLSGRGVRLTEKEGEYMLVTAPEVAGAVEKFTKEELGENLSKVALETLSIIVYKGPISRAEVDYIRGVNSSFTLRNLMIRGLIERTADKADSRVFLYKPSFEFLKFAGIDRIESLPQYQEFRREINAFKTAREERKESAAE